MEWVQNMLAGAMLFVSSLFGFVSSPDVPSPPVVDTAEVRETSSPPTKPVPVTTSTVVVAPQDASTLVKVLASTTPKYSGIVVERARVIAQVYESDSDGPLFATLTLPRLIDNQKDYPIYLWNGTSYELYKNLSPLTELTFPNGGVDRFKIGIDPELRLYCDSLFLKQVTFNSSGTFKGKSMRLTNSLEHPVCD